MSQEFYEDGKIIEGGLPFQVEHDLQIMDGVSSGGILHVQSTLEVDGFDKIVINKPFSEVIQYILDNTDEDYRELYSISNQLVSEADRLRDLAQKIEDSEHNVADLFDTSYDSTA